MTLSRSNAQHLQVQHTAHGRGLLPVAVHGDPGRVHRTRAGARAHAAGYYLALGLASPAAFAATRLQTVVLAFPPADRYRGLTLRFAVTAGLVLGVLPLAFTLPGLAELYYVSLQNLDPADLGLVRWTAATLVFFPLATALRGQSEGLSAWLKRPSAVLFGHSMFLVAILLVGLATLALGAPGCFIGALSLPVGSLVSSATMRLALHGKAASAAGAIV